MKLRHRRSTTKLFTLFASLGVLFVGLFAVIQVTRPVAAAGEGQHLMTVYDRGVVQSYLTEAKTMKGALKDGGYELDERDRVEPGIDEELVASEYQVNIYRARPVVVVDGLVRQKIMTAYQTPEQIAIAADVSLYPEDIAEFRRSTDVVGDGAGLQVVIDRAVSVTLDLFGDSLVVRTQGETVSDLFKEKGVKLGKDDRTSLPLETTITEGMTLRVWREGVQTLNKEEPLPHEVKIIQDANRDLGYEAVETPGVDGVQRVTYEIVVKNGEEVSRKEIAHVVVKQPETEVVIVGTKVNLTTNVSKNKVAIMSAAGVAESDQKYAAYIIDNENALWCAIRWQGTNGCGESYYEKFLGAELSSQVGYGLCQATPGIKMASAGSDWRTNEVTQMRWCHGYAIGRYGSWEAAYRFKVANGWW